MRSRSLSECLTVSGRRLWCRSITWLMGCISAVSLRRGLSAGHQRWATEFLESLVKIIGSGLGHVATWWFVSPKAVSHAGPMPLSTSVQAWRNRVHGSRTQTGNVQNDSSDSIEYTDQLVSMQVISATVTNVMILKDARSLTFELCTTFPNRVAKVSQFSCPSPQQAPARTAALCHGWK